MRRQPSYKRGFYSPARGGRPAYPELWPTVGSWCASLGPTGNTLLDHSGLGNEGTLTTMDPGTDWVLSGGKYALDFVTDDYISAKNTLSVNSGTIAGWLYFRSSDIGGQFAISHYFGGNRIYLQNRLVSGVYYVTCGFGNNQHLIAGACSLNTWVHGLATWNGTNAELFINGASVGTAAYSGLSALASTINIGRVNAAGGIGYWDGLLDDLRLYDRILTQPEVKTLALRRGIAYELRPVQVRGFRAAATLANRRRRLLLASAA